MMIHGTSVRKPEPKASKSDSPSRTSVAGIIQTLRLPVCPKGFFATRISPTGFSTKPATTLIFPINAHEFLPPKIVIRRPRIKCQFIRFSNRRNNQEVVKTISTSRSLPPREVELAGHDETIWRPRHNRALRPPKQRLT